MPAQNVVGSTSPLEFQTYARESGDPAVAAGGSILEGAENKMNVVNLMLRSRRFYAGSALVAVLAAAVWGWRYYVS